MDVKTKREMLCNFVQEKTEEAERLREKRRQERGYDYETSDSSSDDENLYEREEAEFEFSRNISRSYNEDDYDEDEEDSDDYFDSDDSDENGFSKRGESSRRLIGLEEKDEDSEDSEDSEDEKWRKNKVQTINGEQIDFGKCSALFKTGLNKGQSCEFTVTVVDFKNGKPIPHCNRHKFRGEEIYGQMSIEEYKPKKKVKEPRKPLERESRKSEARILLDKLDESLDRLFKKFESL
ncbi:hypothetical protein BY458DRAFT_512327 [Sporodiniella umbellata]|nr:hypothetical protein BY458DRAFT_512327 [Sporodiniella umbellata]